MDGSQRGVKGPGRDVSMVVWLIGESGNHAIAGIWHEGTELQGGAGPVSRVEPGKRQYALFAGLAALEYALLAALRFGRNEPDAYAQLLPNTWELTPGTIMLLGCGVVGLCFARLLPGWGAHPVTGGFGGAGAGVGPSCLPWGGASRSGRDPARSPKTRRATACPSA